MSALLILAAAASSIVGSTVGVGGGALLLSALAYMVPVVSIVPMHGVVQSASCFSRSIAFWKYIDWKIVVPFYYGLIPSTLFAAIAAKHLVSINPHFLLMIISLYILATVFLERLFSKISSRHSPFTVGIICGGLGVFVGSTGPVVSSWLISSGVVKEFHIANKSMMQYVAHALKIVVFIFFLDFDFLEYFFILTMMSLAAVGCTFIGKKILLQMSDRTSVLIVKSILVLVSFNILIKGVIGVV